MTLSPRAHYLVWLMTEKLLWQGAIKYYRRKSYALHRHDLRTVEFPAAVAPAAQFTWFALCRLRHWGPPSPLEIPKWQW